MRTVLFVLLLLLGPPAAALSHAARVPAGGGTGKVFLTVEEALQLAFPECEITRRTVYLTAAQKERAGKLAGFEVERGIVRPYVATRDGVVVGTAYFDAHRVRTKRETLMIVVDRQRRIQRLELLAFAEPVQYVPNGKWYAQFLANNQVYYRIDTLTYLGAPGNNSDTGIIVYLEYGATTIGFVDLGATSIVDG